MDAKKIVAELKERYPGKKVILNNKQNPTEVICEIESREKHPDYSTVISVIDQTELHYHSKTAEIYYVLEGRLELIVEDARFILNKGQYRIIPPGKAHQARGKACWVLLYSEPGWQEEDTFKVKKKLPVLMPCLNTVRLFTTNYPSMISFYQQTLGLTVSFGSLETDYAEFETGDAKISIGKTEKMPKLIQSKLTKSKQAVVISLQVENIPSAYKFLEAKKVQFLQKPTKHKELGIEVFYLEDPEGNLLEIYSKLE